MAGIRIGGIAVLPPREPDIPILVLQTGGITERAVWKIGNGATPVKMFQTAVSSVSSPDTHLGDPQREPTYGESCVYSRFTNTGTIARTVRIVDWDDTNDIELYADPTGGAAGSLQPTWKPDGTRILFRAKGAGTNLNLIKEMDPDGSNVTTLYTGGAINLLNPLYNFDGTRIAWVEPSQTIMVANSDGTGATAIYTAGGSDQVSESIAWGTGSNIIAFRDDGPSFTSDENWMVMNDDGTGLTTWLTISRAAGYGPSDSDPTPIMYSWTVGDFTVVSTVRQIADPDPDSALAHIDSSGQFLISPARYSASNQGTLDQRPVVITGFDEQVERIYWLESTSGDQVVSIEVVGSGDYRVDFNVANATFHGFRGDTLTP